MNLFKIIGLIIVFTVPCIFGFLKSYNLSKRSEKLKGFFTALGELASRVRVENIPKEKLYEKCFTKELLNKDLSVNPEFLKPNDINFLNEFLSGFGVKDKISESERIKLYSERLSEILETANKEKDKLCKLYSSLGVLSGVAFCIFLF